MVFKKISPWWFIIAALASWLWLQHLLMLGMFMDGVYNALLAENLYKHISTFWAPQTVAYGDPYYWDNPPLSMWFLSLFYHLFGDHYIVERVYSLTCALLQLCLIYCLWRILFKQDERLKKYAWLPCLLWIISPLTGWCYSYNLMENTMSLFITAAIMVSVRYVLTGQSLLPVSGLSAVLLLLAFITKGPVSLFPLALPVLMIGLNAHYSIKKGLIFSMLQTGFFMLTFGVLFSFPAPQNFLSHYYTGQLKRALNHTVPIAYQPFFIFKELLIALVPFLLLGFLRLGLTKRLKDNSFLKSLSWRFILLGLCGTIPIALSIKQRKFYLLPAMVPFAIGFAAWLLPLIDFVRTSIQQKWRESFSTVLKIVSVLFIIFFIFQCFSNQGKIIRDEDVLVDLQNSAHLVKGESVIRADWGYSFNYVLRGYAYRLYGIKLCLPDEPSPASYYMASHDTKGLWIPGQAQKVFSSKTFDLYH